MITHVRK